VTELKKLNVSHCSYSPNLNLLTRPRTLFRRFVKLVMAIAQKTFLHSDFFTNLTTRMYL
jgi:hypothetical protein